MNNKAIKTTYSRFGVENIRQCEEYANISRPNKSSDVYKKFNDLVASKIAQATAWLSGHNIEYTWNERIDGHLYRLCIPSKDILFDFECYPVVNPNYNYIRINYDTDIIVVLEKLFPEQVFETDELTVWKITQKAANRFFKENNISPIYDNSILRIALVKDTTIYQCIAIKDNKVVANVVKHRYMIKYGTYILLRYLTEVFELPEILIKENLDNSYTTTLYQLLNLKKVKETTKRKIWWSDSPKWHISKDEIDNYVPFYLTETITYQYIQK